jgi:hypothetical protein
MGRAHKRTRIVSTVAVVGLGAALVAGTASSAQAQLNTGHPSTTTKVLAVGGSLTQPDDITVLGGHVFVAFQNGVGSMGEPSPSGGATSTVVEYTRTGHRLDQWDLTGKVDGMGADTASRRIVATVNEDGNSSLYTITADARHGSVRHSSVRHSSVRHYTYSSNPLPHGGGTDGVVVKNGTIYVTASAPAPDPDGTTFSGPALYRVTLTGSVAHLASVFQDSSSATDAATGKTVTLNLSDPDSSLLMPQASPRFAGDLMLDSQADSRQVFIRHPGTASQHATVLTLSTQVDDSAVVTSKRGTLYATDGTADTITAISGTFTPGEVFTAVPSDSTTLPGTLGRLDLSTGVVSPYAPAAHWFTDPKGLLFVPQG